MKAEEDVTPSITPLSYFFGIRISTKPKEFLRQWNFSPSSRFTFVVSMLISKATRLYGATLSLTTTKTLARFYVAKQAAWVVSFSRSSGLIHLPSLYDNCRQGEP